MFFIRNLLFCLICIVFLGLRLPTSNTLIHSLKLKNRTHRNHTPKFIVELPPECVSEHYAIDDFPLDFFTQEQRESGLIIVHIAISMYIFVVLALICENYFVPSLGFISEKFNLTEDVSGATLMAAGSSAPTVFIALISVFLVENATDIGVGTIVGSTIFNTLCIIGFTGLSVPKPITIMWYPLLRDTIAYLTSTSTLIISVSDGSVHWFESLIFLVVYSLYILAIVNNSKLERLAHNIHDLIFGNNFNHNKTETNKRSDKEANEGTKHFDIEKNHIAHIEESELTIFNFPIHWFDRLKWIFGIVVVLLFDLLTPKCILKRKPLIYHILRFLISIGLLGFFSYILVWMVCIIGYTMKIPDCVMGMTFLAAGSSLPDLMASIVVSRNGNADMAVANAVGSNVFDMLCLGLPWFIKTAMISPGTIIEIQNQSTTISTTLLIGSMLYTLVVLYLNRWTISKKMGYMFLAVYLSLIMFASIMETLQCPCDLHL